MWKSLARMTPYGQVQERSHTTAVHRWTRAKERVEGVRGFDEINESGVKEAGK